MAGLYAVAEVRILTGDAIGQRVKVGFAGNDCAGRAKLLNQP